MKDPMRTNTIPQNGPEMTELVFRAGFARAYIDVTVESRRRKLNEHEIGLIERNITDMVTTYHPSMADEFQTFEVEPAMLKAREMLKEFFAIAKAARIKDIQEK